MTVIRGDGTNSMAGSRHFLRPQVVVAADESRDVNRRGGPDLEPVSSFHVVEMFRFPLPGCPAPW